MLLQYGADPRLYAEDGLTPAQQSSFEHVREVLNSWDIALTDGMLQKLQAERDKQQDDDRQVTVAETEKLETQLLAAEKEYAMIEKQVDHSIIPYSNLMTTLVVQVEQSVVCVYVCVCMCADTNFWTE